MTDKELAATHDTWEREEFGAGTVLAKHRDGSYMDTLVQMRWLGFQAGFHALLAQPATDMPPTPGRLFVTREQAKEALAAVVEAYIGGVIGPVGVDGEFPAGGLTSGGDTGARHSRGPQTPEAIQAARQRHEAAVAEADKRRRDQERVEKEERRQGIRRPWSPSRKVTR